MPAFVPGLILARAFYEEVVAPRLAGIEHSATLLGTGSDVLGFDTERSTDHGWGPRLQVFVAEADVSAARAALDALPTKFRGWPTGPRPDRSADVVVVTVTADWFREQIGFDPGAGITMRDWLTTPQEALLEITAGAVFHDGLGELAPAREALAWYPDDVWLWLIACQWRRIDQEEPFVGRTAEVGDDLGSRIVAARLVRDVVRMCFLQERRYAPYSKWLGSAFRHLDAFDELGDHLLAVLAAVDYKTREAALLEVLTRLAVRHNALGITAHVEETVRLFHDRPFRVLGSGRFVDACLERVSDPRLRSLPLTGAVDQFVDSTDVLSKPKIFPRASEFLQD